MYRISDFYDICKANDADVIASVHLPDVAMTVRIDGMLAVGIDFSVLNTVRLLRSVTMHESGHVSTGCLSSVSSPFQLVQQNEYRADAESFKRFLTSEDLKEAFSKGYTEPWQLAEYFDLEEETVTKALHYWHDCRGVDFNSDKEIS